MEKLKSVNMHYMVTLFTHSELQRFCANTYYYTLIVRYNLNMVVKWWARKGHCYWRCEY